MLYAHGDSLRVSINCLIDFQQVYKTQSQREQRKLNAMRHFIYFYTLNVTTAYDECTMRYHRKKLREKSFHSARFSIYFRHSSIQWDQWNQREKLDAIIPPFKKQKNVTWIYATTVICWYILYVSWHTKRSLKINDQLCLRRTKATKEFIELETNQYQVFSFFAANFCLLVSPKRKKIKLMKHLHKAVWPTTSWSGKYRQYIFSMEED